MNGGNEKSQLIDNIIDSFERSCAKGAEYYREAAEDGDPAAQNAYGWCFIVGNGVNKDFYEAVRWFRSAAKQ